MYCPSCGSNNQEDVKFCNRCGTNLGVVSDALAGNQSGALERDERTVKLLKDYYRSRRMTIIGAVASLVALFKLTMILLIGFPEKLMLLTALAGALFLYGIIALMWGLHKWNDSSSEIKAMGFSPPKGKRLRAAPERLRLAADQASIGTPRFTTDPIKIPSSVTEQTTHLLEERDYKPL